MVTEDERVLDIVKILRTRIEDTKDETELILMHQAKDKDNLVIADELKFWEENELMKVTISMERPGEDWEGIKGKFGIELLLKGLPLPTTNKEEIVLICVKEDKDYEQLRALIIRMGFVDVYRL